MDFQDLVFACFVAQMLAAVALATAWVLMQTWRFISTFYRAARLTQVKITCGPKEKS